MGILKLVVGSHGLFKVLWSWVQNKRAVQITMQVGKITTINNCMGGCNYLLSGNTKKHVSSCVKILKN